MRKIDNTTWDLETTFPDTIRESMVAIAGGSDPLTFKPHLHLEKWSGEAYFDIYVPGAGHVDAVEEGGKVKWKGIDKEVHFYEKGHSKKTRKSVKGKYSHLRHGGAEFDIVWNSKPLSNVITLGIDAPELDFFYQPPLTVAEKESMEIDRPPHIEGGYAVYHKTKVNNQYRTGQICLIYRPEVYDNSGKMVYADLSIDSVANTLTVVVPQSFLDTAVYPVVVDPTFGYETQGGSTKFSAYFIGSVFAGAAGTATNVSAYCIQCSTGATIGIYKHSDLGLVSGTGKNISATPLGWWDFAINGTISAVDYILAWGAYIGTKDYGGINYNAGDANQGHITTNGYATTAPSSIAIGSHDTNKYSIHCDYTASASGPAKLKTWNGLATAKIKTINGLAIAKVKTINGLT
jgi:hypothetical protein